MPRKSLVREPGLNPTPPRHELYHEIFGSILDRTEMAPYLLLRSGGYRVALRQATRMLGNRGFDTQGADKLRPREKARAQNYVRQVRRYLLDWLLPFAKKQLAQLAALTSSNRGHYRACQSAIGKIQATLADQDFRRLVDRDPRHLFLLASSGKYPGLFHGYRGQNLDIPDAWQRVACAMLKMGHIIKSIEEDSQDIHDYAQLGIFLESQSRSLDDLFCFNWDNPDILPEDEAARRAFVKLSSFFHKLMESMTFDRATSCLVFNSGDGVEVDIVDVKARLKSPESMFTKLGKSVEGEAHDIRDILAITFLLKSRDDTLTLFHALQKRGVILQENTVSHSITQTLFDSPSDMIEAVRRLALALARSEGKAKHAPMRQLRAEAKEFFNALNVNARQNLDSAHGHRKFQCKINYSLPIHRDAATNQILVPGTAEYATRDARQVKTQQHTLGVELRISDRQSWYASELKGESHHDAYRFRQLLALMNRLFRPSFDFPREADAQLRRDQGRIFA
jgi:uncharacterized protein (TIGR04562 family)